MTTLFIGNLPFQADEAFVRGLLEPYGRVGTVELHADWVDPRQEPCAYAQLAAADADQVVLALDGKAFGHTHIRVHRRVALTAEGGGR